MLHNNSSQVYAENDSRRNIVKDYNKHQGVYHPTDHGIRRSLDVRRVSIENSSDRSIGISINRSGEESEINFVLAGGETKFVGINTVGEGSQFIILYHPVTNKRVSFPTLLSTESNAFVLRDGINNWFVQKFHYAVFNAAH